MIANLLLISKSDISLTHLYWFCAGFGEFFLEFIYDNWRINCILISHLRSVRSTYFSTIEGKKILPNLLEVASGRADFCLHGGILGFLVQCNEP